MEMTTVTVSRQNFYGPSVQPEETKGEIDQTIINVTGETLKQFELEKRLHAILNPIEERRKWSLKKVICLAFDSFCKEKENHPLKTLAKVTISLVGLGAIYPAVIGSWACIKTLQVIPLSDMESSDRETAMLAAQGIGNVGMAITYMVHLQEFVFHPIVQLFTDPYNQKICEEIRTIYSKALLINRARMSTEEIRFLIKRENKELSHYNGLAVSDTADVDEIQDQIDQSLKTRLSVRNIIHLTTLQIKKDVANSSWIDIATKIAKTALVVGLVGGSSFILGTGTYGCYKPFDLQDPYELESSDPKEVQDATANYANTGHGLEYLAIMGILGLEGIRSTIGGQYKTVMHQQIREVYRPLIEAKSQRKNVSDLLNKRMKQTLSQY